MFMNVYIYTIIIMISDNVSIINYNTIPWCYNANVL